MKEKSKAKPKHSKEKGEKPVSEREPLVEEQSTPCESEVVDSAEQTLQAENDQLKEKLLRQMAEFDNYKKRTVKEKDELYSRAKAETVEGMLPVLDNFERALQTNDCCSDNTFAQGVEMIFTQLLATLEKLGVEEIDAQGTTFDPALHHAVQQIEDAEQDSNTVCEVLQKGYRLGERVIRHAMVVVANP